MPKPPGSHEAEVVPVVPSWPGSGKAPEASPSTCRGELGYNKEKHLECVLNMDSKHLPAWLPTVTIPGDRKEEAGGKSEESEQNKFML